MTKLMNKIIRLILSFFICFIVINYIKVAEGEDTMKSVWEPFGKWYEWKKVSHLTKEQKSVIDYFNHVDKIKNRVRKLRANHMAAEKSIVVIKKCMSELGNVPVPKICNVYHNAFMKGLRIELEYQEGKRAKLSENELRKIELKYLSVDGIQFTAFFQALKDVGLFDNVEKEMKKFESK
jgi:ribosomal protein S24E